MINQIIQFSINRRYFMVVVIMGLVTLGLFSYQKLTIDAVPDITNVQVQINTEAPGYAPTETEQRITYPIEKALYGLPEMAYTRSISRYGLSQITVVFNEGTDIYFARNLIDERLGTLKNTLPAGIEPTMGPIATGLGEIFMYTIEAEAGATDSNGQPLDAIALRAVQDWIIKPQLAQVPGVVEINTLGGKEKQFHVLPDPALMLEHNVTLALLTEGLRKNNDNRGAGFLEHNGQQLLVRSEGQLKTIEDIEQVVLKTHASSPVRVKDVAEVAVGSSLRSGAATSNGNEVVLGTAMMLKGGNAQQVARRFAQKLKDIKPSLPPGIVINTVYDRTTLVNKTIHTVQTNLLEGALLVMVVLFVMLGHFRAALLTAAVIPLSMLATVFGMVKTGVSANLMSLGALDFGLIVDGAVIIVENCIRRLAMAQSEENRVLAIQQRLVVVFQATQEVIKPALFGIFIITVVYIPIFSLSGVEGKMFHPMAATVVMALLAAMLLSLTVVPALVAILLNNRISEKENRIVRSGKALYQPVLRWALKARHWVLVMASVLVAFSAWLMSTLGSEFVPQLDEGDITMHAMRIPGTSLSQSTEMQRILEKALLNVPEVAKVFSKIGTADIANDPMPPNVTDTFVLLKERKDWPDPLLPKNELVHQIETLVSQIPGNNYEFTQPIQMRFNELISGVRSDLGIKVYGDDMTTLKQVAAEVLSVLQASEGAADARTEQVEDIPLLSIDPNRTMLARYGLSTADLQQLITTAMGGTDVGIIYQGDRRFSLTVRLPEHIRHDQRQLASLPVPLPNGGYIPLSEVADFNHQSTAAQISRENGKRRIVITANVRDRDLGTFVTQVKEQIKSTVDIPPGYWVDYGGTFEQLESATQKLLLVVPITLLCILAILVMAMGSIKEALIVFSGIPLALTGGVFALWLRDMPLSISAGVGFIALSGVAVLNGLVLVAFIKKLWQQQGDLMGAIVEGALTRFRPVLMTALVASLGFIPMALNTGTGAEVQRPLATVVIGGITSSTVLTLVVLPVLYFLLNQNRKP